jgi:hypothetical protein
MVFNLINNSKYNKNMFKKTGNLKKILSKDIFDD